MLGLQTARVGNDREIASALDRGRQLALMPRAGAAQATRQNLAVIRDEAAEHAVVLVIDEMHARLAEGTGFLGSSHGLLLVLVVVLLATTVGGGELFFRHRRSTELVLVESDQVADDALVELDRALVLGERRGVGGEASDGVIAGLAAPDWISELASAPVIDLEIARISEQSVDRPSLSEMAASSSVESKT